MVRSPYIEQQQAPHRQGQVRRSTFQLRHQCGKRFALRALHFLDVQIQQRERLHELQATYLGNQQMQRSQLRLRRRASGQCAHRHHLEVRKVRKRRSLRKLREF